MRCGEALRERWPLGAAAAGGADLADAPNHPSTCCPAPTPTDTTLPQVVVPYLRPGHLPRGVPMEIRPRRLGKNHKREQWRKLANAYAELHAASLHRAEGVAYLRELAGGHGGEGVPLPGLPWHCSIGVVQRLPYPGREVPFMVPQKPLQVSWQALPSAGAPAPADVAQGRGVRGGRGGGLGRGRGMLGRGARRGAARGGVHADLD